MTWEAGCNPDHDLKAEIRPDPTLLAEGWVRRFLVDPVRAEEMLEMYRTAGFEAMTHPVRPEEFDARCGDCPAVVCRTYVMLYTRSK